MDNLSKMKELIAILNKASDNYYLYDKPSMTDKQYDDLMDELRLLEQQTGVIMSNSPTHKVQGKLLDGLKKVKHTRPMLSADKTKDMDVVERFIQSGEAHNSATIESWKLDGLTVVCRYINGEYKQAITRGDGAIGENITEAIKHCINIPMKLAQPVDIEVRGECLISWENFKKINETLFEPYSHPRNLAAGSVRCLDTNIAKLRYLEYKVFELIQTADVNMNISDSYTYLQELGFDVVEHKTVASDNYEAVDEQCFNPENCPYPVDGVIYRYDNYKYGHSLGSTAHHPLDMLARKWTDELYETKLIGIEWNTTRTGVINPVAVFEPVNLDGAVTTRATLHNVSYIENLQLGIGDTIRVYRSNGVIPKVHDNLTKSRTCLIPSVCPCCGMRTEIHDNNGSRTLHCVNPYCSAKLLDRLVHFCSRDAMNIEGLSKATLQFLIDMGWVKHFYDLYDLDIYADEWIKADGFGLKSVDKLLENIDKSKQTTLDRFLYAMGIPLIGKSASRDIAKACNGDIHTFIRTVLEDGTDFMKIEGFGSEMNKSLLNWWNRNHEDIFNLINLFNFQKENKSMKSSADLSNKVFVITGSLGFYKNRDELVKVITDLGGKVSNSVSAKTSYLINNDINSTSSKNKKAKELGVPIIREQDFFDMIQ